MVGDGAAGRAGLEEALKRKDAIIRVRNAQISALWDELHTRQPWTNALAGDAPINLARLETVNASRRLLVIGINTVRAPAPIRAAAAVCPGVCRQAPRRTRVRRLTACGRFVGRAGAAVCMHPGLCLRCHGAPIALRKGKRAPLTPGLRAAAQGLGARARRDNLRRTWVPTGKALQALEDEKGVVIRFLIGYRRGPRLRAPASGPARAPGQPIMIRLPRHRVV